MLYIISGYTTLDGYEAEIEHEVDGTLAGAIHEAERRWPEHETLTISDEVEDVAVREGGDQWRDMDGRPLFDAMREAADDYAEERESYWQQGV